MNCTYCQAPQSALQSRGHKGNRHVYLCTNCGHFPSYDEKENHLPAKTLIFDIETAPLSAYIWGTGKQHVNVGQVFEESFVISWSAKWLYDSNVMFSVVSSDEALARDDSRVLSGIWNLLDEADILIGHNIQNFDIPKLNTRFLYNGFDAPSRSKTIDTYTVASSQFKFTSNKLDYICKYLGLPHKVETGGLQLWIDCLHGNENSLNKMVTYNQNDVLINEEVYVKLRPFIRNHPNVNIYEPNDSCCPSCGFNGLSSNGLYYTNVAAYQSFRCENCGSLSRSRKNKFDKNRLKKTILLGV